MLESFKIAAWENQYVNPAVAHAIRTANLHGLYVLPNTLDYFVAIRIWIWALLFRFFEPFRSQPARTQAKLKVVAAEFTEKAWLFGLEQRIAATGATHNYNEAVAFRQLLKTMWGQFFDIAIREASLLEPFETRFFVGGLRNCLRDPQVLMWLGEPLRQHPDLVQVLTAAAAEAQGLLYFNLTGVQIDPRVAIVDVENVAPVTDIFVSYSHADLPVAARLAEKIRCCGNVWFDRNLSDRTVFDREIADRLDDAKVVLALWSPHSIRSDWVRAEAMHARKRGRLRGAIIAGCELPPPFNIEQTFDLTRWAAAESNEEDLKRLVQLIDQDLTGLLFTRDAGERSPNSLWSP